MEGKATNRHVFLRMVREVEMSRGWFRSVFIVNLNIPKVFAETITQSAARFALSAFSSPGSRTFVFKRLVF